MKKLMLSSRVEFERSSTSNMLVGADRFILVPSVSKTFGNILIGILCKPLENLQIDFKFLLEIMNLTCSFIRKINIL
jgi:hypothetical protein